ncbi:hypothetical protein AK812_SmicGene14303 [Symbiodinium microadriaticum]|uniref:Sulfotransferase domain-containing protein n=1 Tax=Symbiodinium microadriaticum TaxID=2951 RepID=A0A1Q9E5V6_SYMMI|nr:hypothetical protein AK812_SmicGene14303 [Symbiodinium microadriaticum]
MCLHPYALTWAFFVMLFIFEPLAKLVSTVARSTDSADKREQRAGAGLSSFASPASSSSAPCKGPKLIIHVGPQKTGTTAIQEFLVKTSGWLQEQWGVSVGFHGSGKAVVEYIVHPLMYFCNGKRTRWNLRLSEEKVKQKLKDGLGFLQSKLNSSQLVVLSSEDFQKFDNKSWQCFRSEIRADTCQTAVVLHRSSATWIAARWSQGSKYDSSPKSFSSYVASKMESADAHGDSDKQLQQLNRLRPFDRVIPVSYDYLKEVNCSGAAFLICNASLGLTGKNWLQCRNSVNGRSSKLRNKSPPHAAIDVVRLARHFYEMKQAMRKNVSRCKPWPIGKWSDGYLFRHPDMMTSTNPAVIQVAKQIPVKCENFDGLFRSETQKWFSRTGAKRPRYGSKDICTADVASFEAKHWRLIGKIAPDC